MVVDNHHNTRVRGAGHTRGGPRRETFGDLRKYKFILLYTIHTANLFSLAHTIVLEKK